jgi:hypothetical protein
MFHLKKDICANQEKHHKDNQIQLNENKVTYACTLSELNHFYYLIYVLMIIHLISNKRNKFIYAFDLFNNIFKFS